MIENLQTAPPSIWWVGFLVVAVYFGIGLMIGLLVVVRNLPRFHGAGFQWKRMIKHIAVVALVWPVALAELIFG